MVDLPAPEAPTNATLFPAGTSRVIRFRAAFFGHIGKTDIFETDVAFNGTQIHRPRFFEDFRFRVQKLEQALRSSQPFLKAGV